MFNGHEVTLSMEKELFNLTNNTSTSCKCFAPNSSNSLIQSVLYRMFRTLNCKSWKGPISRLKYNKIRRTDCFWNLIYIMNPFRKKGGQCNTDSNMSFAVVYSCCSQCHSWVFQIPSVNKYNRLPECWACCTAPAGPTVVLQDRCQLMTIYTILKKKIEKKGKEASNYTKRRVKVCKSM